MRYLAFLCAALSLPALASSIKDLANSNVQTFKATPASCAAARTKGTSMQHQSITSPVDGNSLTFSIFEPASINCATKHPLLVTSHGWSDTRLRDSSKVAQYTSRGYVVISIDQRGHGDSDGTKHIMSPSWEVQDNLAVLDWAEANLDYLAYRDGNLLLGTFGSSYGGGFQLMMNAHDPKARLDAMAPTVTWYDLGEALAPGGVSRESWVSQLLLSGELASNIGAAAGLSPKTNNSGGLDDMARNALLTLSSTGRSNPVIDGYFSTRSFSYACGERPTLPYTFDEPDPSKALQPAAGYGTARAIPTLVIAGASDAIFPMRHAIGIQNCMQRGGAPAYYVGSLGAHPVLPSNLGLTQDLAVPGFKPVYDPNYADDQLVPSKTCGSIAISILPDFFDQYLLHKNTKFSDAMKGKSVCLAPSLKPARAAFFDHVPQAALGDANTFHLEPVTISAADFTLYMEHGPVAALPLARATTDFDVFGIPKLSFDVQFAGSITTSSDPVLYAGLATIRDGRYRLLNNQPTVIRGLGAHQLDMEGMSETVSAGDTLYFVVYNMHPQMGQVASALNVLTPFVSVQASVSVPVFNGTYDRLSVGPSVATRSLGEP